MLRHAFTALMVAAAWCAIHVYAQTGEPPLVNAARNDDGPAVNALLAKHAGVNSRSGDGMTALAWSAMHSDLEMARALLKASANPNLSNTRGITPLALAIVNGSEPFVKLLLQNKANPNLVRASGESPLMTAARLSRADMMTLLIDHGANVNARENKFHQTALMWAAGDADAVRLLLDHHADFRAVTKSWDIQARKYGNGFSTLGKTGIPWVVQGEFDTKVGGYNALLFAVEKRNRESARLLLDAGADVNSTAADGSTPLLMALYQFQSTTGALDVDLPMASLLLDRGAKSNVADLVGYTPLHGVALAVAELTKPAPAGRGGRGRGAPLGVPRAPNPVAARAAAAVVSRRGGIAAEDAPALPDLLALARRLLEAGADPNRRTLNPTPGPVGDTRINPAPPGSSPFHIAAGARYLDLVKLMEEHSADPNLPNREGHTPFSVAVKTGNLENVKEMVAHGADLAARYDLADMIADPVESIARPRKGQTIMHVAVVAGQVKTIQYLHSIGVPLALKNEANETPLMLADSMERYQAAQAKQNGREVPRSTAITDAIKALLGRGSDEAFR